MKHMQRRGVRDCPYAAFSFGGLSAIVSRWPFLIPIPEKEMRDAYETKYSKFNLSDSSFNSNRTCTTEQGQTTVFSYPDSITIDTPNTQVGVVFKKFVGTYHVEVNGEIVICSISSRLRKHLIYPEAD